MERSLISISSIVRGQVPKKWNGEDTNSDVSDPEGTPLPPKRRKFGKERTLISMSPILRGQVPPKRRKFGMERH